MTLLHVPASFPGLKRCEGYLYTETRELARGSTATVYAAIDCEAKRLVALKLLDRLGPAEPYEHFAARLRQLQTETEVYGAVRAQEPQGADFVIATLDANTDPEAERAYHVMPLADRSLRGLIEEQRQLGEPLTRRQVSALTTQMACGLSAAHRCGYVHRDVKPENVLLFSEPGEGYRARMADFGIAKAAQDATTQQQGAPPIGTRGYMSPEQIQRGRERATEASDVWSLGVVVYELLVLARPWANTDQAANGWSAAAAARAASLWGDVGALETVTPWFRRCLAMRPRDRFETPSEAAEELRTLLAAAEGGWDEPLVREPRGGGPSAGLSAPTLKRQTGSSVSGAMAIPPRSSTRTTPGTRRRRTLRRYAPALGAVAVAAGATLWNGLRSRQGPAKQPRPPVAVGPLTPLGNGSTGADAGAATHDSTTTEPRKSSEPAAKPPPTVGQNQGNATARTQGATTARAATDKAAAERAAAETARPTGNDAEPGPSSKLDPAELAKALDALEDMSGMKNPAERENVVEQENLAERENPAEGQ